jgi:ABC-type multidrug transport system fused ATPase/permease subunit
MTMVGLPDSRTVEQAGRSVGPTARPTDRPTAVIDVRAYNFWYGATQALFDLTFTVPRRAVTALIGPSGCGKSTFLRSINRLNELIPNTRRTGDILLERHGPGGAAARGGHGVPAAESVPQDDLR